MDAVNSERMQPLIALELMRPHPNGLAAWLETLVSIVQGATMLSML